MVNIQGCRHVALIGSELVVDRLEQDFGSLRLHFHDAGSFRLWNFKHLE